MARRRPQIRSSTLGVTPGGVKAADCLSESRRGPFRGLRSFCLGRGALGVDKTTARLEAGELKGGSGLFPAMMRFVLNEGLGIKDLPSNPFFVRSRPCALGYIIFLVVVVRLGSLPERIDVLFAVRGDHNGRGRRSERPATTRARRLLTTGFSTCTDATNSLRFTSFFRKKDAVVSSTDESSSRQGS